MIKIIPVLAGYFSVLVGVAVSASAAAEGHGGHEAITFMGDWLPRLVNFAIIAFVVVYFSGKPIRDFFKNRSLEIARAMQESKDARERAVAALAEMEHKMKDLENETERLISDAKARGEKDKQAAIEEGKKMASDIQTQVRQSIDVEVQKAKAELQTEAALLAVNLAESSIRQQIGQADHERIVGEYIAKVGGKG